MPAKFQVKGKMSTFGGPDDTGMTPEEGLALFTSEEHMREHGLGDFLLPQKDYPDFGLDRRLNTKKFYVACRWPYGKLSKQFLRDAWVWVENPATGRKEKARPVDYGPAKRTGRVADLSPGLAKAVKLKTDDVCVVTIDKTDPS